MQVEHMLPLLSSNRHYKQFMVRATAVYGSGRKSEPQPGRLFHISCRDHSEACQSECLFHVPAHSVTRYLKPNRMEKRLNSKLNLLSCTVASTWGNPRPVYLVMNERSNRFLAILRRLCRN